MSVCLPHIEAHYKAKIHISKEKRSFIQRISAQMYKKTFSWNTKVQFCESTNKLSLEFPPHLYLQVLTMIGIDEVAPCTDGVSVEISGHSKLGIEEKGLLHKWNGGEEDGTDAVIIIGCVGKGIEQGGFVVIYSGIVVVGVEVYDATVNAKFCFCVLPSNVFSNSKTYLIRGIAEMDELPCC